MVVFAGKNGVRLHLNDNIEIPARAAVQAGFTLAGDFQTAPGFHARRNLYGNFPDRTFAPLPAADRAGVLHHGAGPPAGADCGGVGTTLA